MYVYIPRCRLTWKRIHLWSKCHRHQTSEKHPGGTTTYRCYPMTWDSGQSPFRILPKWIRILYHLTVLFPKKKKCPACAWSYASSHVVLRVDVATPCFPCLVVRVAASNEASGWLWHLWQPHANLGEICRLNFSSGSLQSPTSKEKQIQGSKFIQTYNILWLSQLQKVGAVSSGCFLFGTRNVHPSHPNCAWVLCIDLLLPSTSPSDMDPVTAVTVYPYLTISDMHE